MQRAKMCSRSLEFTENKNSCCYCCCCYCYYCYSCSLFPCSGSTTRCDVTLKMQWILVHVPHDSFEITGHLKSGILKGKTWKCQPSTRIWQKYSSPKYKMISQGMLTVQLLLFEEHFTSLADVQTSFDLWDYHLPLYTQQGIYSHPHTTQIVKTKNKSFVTLLMLLSPTHYPTMLSSSIITFAKLGRYRVQNSNLVQDTDHSDFDFSCSLSEPPWK
jgi:hypothetical protein